MEGTKKLLICLVSLIVVVGIFDIQRAEGASACGKSKPDDEALKLAPCADAVENEKAPVSASCCAQVKRIGQNPSCLCAVMLSDTVKNYGVKPDIALTIPKRCNFVNRPVGYKCGREYYL